MLICIYVCIHIYNANPLGVVQTIIRQLAGKTAIILHVIVLRYI